MPSDHVLLTLIERLRTLRAVRRFASTPIPADALRDILEVGRWTGSAKNCQPSELIVVRERDTLQVLATCGAYAGHLAKAPLAILLVMQDASWQLDEGRLAQSLMLAAWAHGIGSCIGTLYPEENVSVAKALLQVPEDRWLSTAISFGYPEDERALLLSSSTGARPAIPLGRKPLAAFVGWERYRGAAPAHGSQAWNDCSEGSGLPFSGTPG